MDIFEDLYKEQDLQKSIVGEGYHHVVDDIIQKGKAAQIGEIRAWGGVKYRKDVNGWLPVKEGVKVRKEEDIGKNKGKLSYDELKKQKESYPVAKLSQFAKETSESNLNAAIKNSSDPKIREAAHQELDRRNKEEHVNEKKEGGKMGRDILKDKLENNLDKYKKVVEDFYKPDNYNNPDNYKKLEYEQLELSRFINRINKFVGVNFEDELNDFNENFDLKDEEETQKFFGDGKILGIISDNDLVDVLMEDGYCSRSFNDNKVVHMEEFCLDPNLEKGNGEGSKIFFNQVKEFKKKGYKQLKTIAAKTNIYNGYYTWARLGYDFNNIANKRKFLDLINRAKDKDIKSVKSLPELMSFEKGRKFWKENGFSFDGSFDLSDKSKSMFILNRYMEEKKNEKR